MKYVDPFALIDAPASSDTESEDKRYRIVDDTLTGVSSIRDHFRTSYLNQTKDELHSVTRYLSAILRSGMGDFMAEHAYGVLVGMYPALSACSDVPDRVYKSNVSHLTEYNANTMSVRLRCFTLDERFQAAVSCTLFMIYELIERNKPVNVWLYIARYLPARYITMLKDEQGDKNIITGSTKKREAEDEFFSLVRTPAQYVSIAPRDSGLFTMSRSALNNIYGSIREGKKRSPDNACETLPGLLS